MVLSVLIPTNDDRASQCKQLRDQLHHFLSLIDLHLWSSKYGVNGLMFSHKDNTNVYWAKDNTNVFWAIDNFSDCVELIFCRDDKSLSIGEKRNKLIEIATGEYISFIDDDDAVTKDYFIQFFDNLKKVDYRPDAFTLRGKITIDNGQPEIFEHHPKYAEWKTNMLSPAQIDTEVKYERYINHLNFIKKDIAKQITFPEKNHGEDHDYSTALQNSKLITTFIEIPEIIYEYRYTSNK